MKRGLDGAPRRAMDQQRQSIRCIPSDLVQGSFPGRHKSWESAGNAGGLSIWSSPSSTGRMYQTSMHTARILVLLVGAEQWLIFSQCAARSEFRVQTPDPLRARTCVTYKTSV